MSGETGAPLAAIDGTRLTYWRTAAASALAARYLAVADASTSLPGRRGRAGAVPRAGPCQPAPDPQRHGVEPPHGAGRGAGGDARARGLRGHSRARSRSAPSAPPTSSPARPCPACRWSRAPGCRPGTPSRPRRRIQPRRCARRTTTALRRASVFVDTRGGADRGRRRRAGDPAAAPSNRRMCGRRCPTCAATGMAGAAPPTRSRCSSRSAPRSRISPQPCSSGALFGA